MISHYFITHTTKTKTNYRSFFVTFSRHEYMFFITKTQFVLFGHSPELSVAVLLSLAELSVKDRMVLCYLKTNIKSPKTYIKHYKKITHTCQRICAKSCKTC